MKLIIAGSRSLFDAHYYQILCGIMYKIQHELGIPISQIVSGGARGIDEIGEKWAREHKKPCVVFKANWSKYGKAAGPIRNKEMAEYADGVVALWDGVSRGTYHMISTMKEMKKFVYVYKQTLHPIKD